MVSNRNVYIAGLLVALAAPLESQPPAPVAATITYADLADLAVTAPIAAHVQLRSAVPLKGAQAVGVMPGATRFFVEADVLSLIRGAEGLPARINYLVDLSNQPGGRPPRLARKTQYLVLAAPVAGRPGSVRLVSKHAQLPFTAARAEQVRAILREASAPGAPPRITGIGRAFHVPGALPGESETQIFLQTEDARPVSLSVLRRPGEQPRWAVALAEIVDDSAAPPRPDSLLWYRLACTLPPRLPAQSLAEAEAAQAAAIQADYALILARLGACARTLPRS